MSDHHHRFEAFPALASLALTVILLAVPLATRAASPRQGDLDWDKEQQRLQNIGRELEAAGFSSSTTMIPAPLDRNIATHLGQGVLDELRVREAEEALRADGYPINPTEALDRFPVVGLDTNAVTLLSQAVSQMEVGPRMREALPYFGPQGLPSPEEPVALEVRTLMQSTLLLNGEARKTLTAALERDAVQFQDYRKLGVELDVPHLAPLRSLACLLGIEYLEASEARETGKAVQAIVDLLRLAYLIDQEPLVVTHLFAQNLQTMALGQVLHLLQRERLSNDELSALQRGMIDNRHAPGLHRALITELAVDLELFRESDDELARQLALLAPQGHPLMDPNTLSNYRISGRFLQDRLFFIQQITELLRALRQGIIPAGEAVMDLSETLRQETGPLQRLLSGALLGGMITTFGRELLFQARWESLLAALAVERYRRDHQEETPALLANLIPGYLKQPPRNPFTGDALDYGPLDPGFQLLAPFPGSSRNSTNAGAGDLASRGVLILVHR